MGKLYFRQDIKDKRFITKNMINPKFNLDADKRGFR